MGKNEKRENIGNYLDVSNSRFSADEYDTLNDYVSDDSMTGKTYTENNTFTGWSSDGKYTRWEETTYTINDDRSITELYNYRDDDGQEGQREYSYSNAREVLSILKKFK